MKLNVFSVPTTNLSAMTEKFESVGLKPIATTEQAGWKGTFYFSEHEEPRASPWLNAFADLFDGDPPRNVAYFATYLFTRKNQGFAITFGKSHFYVRQFCDHDFGIEMAKRIATEADIKMTSSKRFAGRKRKEIKSWAKNSGLNIESGESIDFVKAGVSEPHQQRLGKVAKFGSSLLINVGIDGSEIGEMLTEISDLLMSKPSFKLPRTVLVTDKDEAAKYDEALVAAIREETSQADFVQASHEVVGVDFVFSGNDQCALTCPGYERKDLGETELGLGDLQSYIEAERIAPRDVLDIKVRIRGDGHRGYTRSLKESLDFIVDGENVMLSNGQWLRFNEDYIEQLNEAIDSILIEPTEDDFQVIQVSEPEFNQSLASAGYVVADKDFSKIKVTTGVPIEAWDLQHGSTVFAVKFGTPQKVGYVCDQAVATLEIIRNNANVKKLARNWKRYCLWLGFENKRLYGRISECDSLILKQKIEAWARRCREMGIEPSLKLSRRSK